MTDRSITEKIYLTYKTRMLSEARLIASAKFYNLLLAWFSFCSIIFSIFQAFGYYSTKDATMIFIAISVGLFGLSIYVSTQNTLGKAGEFKACYLALKEIYEGDGDDKEKMRKYDTVLKTYENQTGSDFDEMVFDAYIRGQNLYDSKGVVALTRLVTARVVFNKIGRVLFRSFLVVSPLLVLVAIPRISDNLKPSGETAMELGKNR